MKNPAAQQYASSSWQMVQFTDTHFFSHEGGALLGVNTAASFKSVLDLAKRVVQEPDVYVITGDLSQDETQESYARLSSYLIDLPAEIYYLPGNHDKRDLMLAGLEAGGANFVHADYFIKQNWLVVLLDSLLEGKINGYLTALELARLQNLLSSYSGLNVLICLHHQPIPVGSKWLDTVGLENAADLLAIIEANSHVKGVLWGHVHQEFELRHNNALFMCTPSSCVQFKPNSERFAIDPIPPGFRLLTFYSDGTIESQVFRTNLMPEGLDLCSSGY